MFFVAGMELRSCERTPHRSQGPQNAYSLPGASFIPVVGRPWPIQLRSPRYLVSSLTSWCGVLYLTSSPPFFRNAKDHGPSAHYRTGIPTAFFKLFILKNHFGGFLLHRRCMLYPCGLGMANVSSVRRIRVHA